EDGIRDFHVTGVQTCALPISSPELRKRVESGQIIELGSNESLNEEVIIAAQPELFIGFGVSNQNKSYATISKAGIPVVYNGDWRSEERRVGKVNGCRRATTEA